MTDGQSIATSSAGSTRGPIASSGTPSARWAAAGVNRSRPWKVELDDRQAVLRVLDLMDADDAAQPFGAGQQQAVVRTDEEVAAAGLDGDRPARRADTGIHHAHMRADGQERQGAPQHQRAVADVVLVDLVGDVDDQRLGRDAKHHAAADGRRGVAHAPVGEQADERPAGRRAGCARRRAW